jgi:sporulation protein YlmC with PRC-barrel domain
MLKKHYLPLVLATMTAGSAAALAQSTSPSTTPAPGTTPNAATGATTPSVTVKEKTTATTTAATAQSAFDFRSTKLVGSAVYNSADEKIGKIDDMIVDAKGAVTSVVIGVGGFLGIGEKNVALPFSSLKTSRDGNGYVKVVVDSTKDSLKAMPDFVFYKSS